MSELRIGIVGLGIMGTAYARNLIQAGFTVTGFDVSQAQSDALADLGGCAVDSVQAVAERSDVILVVLASVKALQDCTIQLAQNIGPHHTICEMGTFSLEQKLEFQSRLNTKTTSVLDCPVSGTGAQAAAGDLSIYVSGDETAANRVKPVFGAMARDIRYIGPFGTGTKLKFIANLLVTVHNLAAAEALLMAQQSDMDLQMVYDAICEGAGTSRMFEVRGPMMIAETYKPATMKLDVYMKDLQLIADHAREINCPTPLMAASIPHYVAGMAQGRQEEDTAALFGILQQLIRSSQETEPKS